jgi:hypothetical protein
MSRVARFMPWNDNRPLEFINFYYFDNIVKLVFIFDIQVANLECNFKTHT